MKRLIILLLMLSPLAAVAQNDAYKALFDSCVGREGYSTVQVTKQMLRMMDNSKYNLTLASIDGVMSITLDSADASAIAEFRKRCDRMIEQSGLSVMMSANGGGEAVNIYTLTVDDRIKEVIVMSFSSSSAAVVDVVGDLTIKQISQLNLSTE